jgi:hypothetical protein
MVKLRGLALGLCLVAIVGCGESGPTLAPVTGTITLDGKPFDNAVISFQPKGSKENPTPGRGSSAITDSQGKFKLVYDGKLDGAVVGKHLVSIMEAGNNAATGEPGVGSSDEVKVDTKRRYVPLEWNANSKVEFDVPAGGSTTANFDIKTKAGAASAPKDAPKADEKKDEKKS